MTIDLEPTLGSTWDQQIERLQSCPYSNARECAVELSIVAKSLATADRYIRTAPGGHNRLGVDQRARVLLEMVAEMVEGPLAELTLVMREVTNGALVHE